MTQSNGSPVEEESAPVSISSLRSKFESLAASNADAAGKKPAPVAPKPNGLRVNGLEGVTGGGSISSEVNVSFPATSIVLKGADRSLGLPVDP
jgi:hypothetical protein